MSRVKMGAKHEYEYLANYKVLQNFFKAKRIDKPVPVEKLAKCKMQYVSTSYPLYLNSYLQERDGAHRERMAGYAEDRSPGLCLCALQASLVDSCLGRRAG